VAAFTGVENLLSAHRLDDGMIEMAGRRIDGLRQPTGHPADVTLAIRSEAVMLLPPGQGDIDGVVSFVQILGASVRYEITIPGDTIVTATEVRRGECLAEIGAALSLKFAPNRSTILTS
jgi:ABC-type Fe3+/spermidine/putrescine transport system ATPase subunit